MTIYRNTQDGHLYYLYKVTPPWMTGHYYESEHVHTHAVSKVRDNQLKNYVGSYER
jgi:hypothetical protein